MRYDSPEFLQRPVVCCAVLGVSDLDGDDGGRAGPVLVVGVVARSQLCRQRRVRRVGEESELELDFFAELYGDRVRFLYGK